MSVYLPTSSAANQADGLVAIESPVAVDRSDREDGDGMVRGGHADSGAQRLHLDLATKL